MPALKNTLKAFDASAYGGAPLLGLKGLVVKTHGSSKAKRSKIQLFNVCPLKNRILVVKYKQTFAWEIRQNRGGNSRWN